jgi:CheY-like chemotaxis protein
VRVLIVDDYEDIATALEMMLSAAGHQVRTALTGQDAIAIAETFEPELAIVDIQLPDTTGYALARKLRSTVRRPLHIIGITGSIQPNLPYAGVFDEHAYKPVTATQLYQMISVAQERLDEAV